MQKYIKFMISLMLFVIFLPPAFADSTTPVPTPVGRVVWIKGNSLKALMPNKEIRLLQKMSLIYLHDVLMTDDKTQAEIVFTDNTLMTFRPSTQFSIDQYAYKPKQKQGSVGKYMMTLLEGGFRTITGLIAKHHPSDYQINTPVATIGVRGTDYAVYLHNDQVYLGEYQGTPCATSGGKGLCLNNKTPYGFVASKQAAPVLLTQQPDVFKEKLAVTPATIAPFASQEPGPGTNGKPPRNGTSNSNSFCISQ